MSPNDPPPILRPSLYRPAILMSRDMGRRFRAVLSSCCSLYEPREAEEAPWLFEHSFTRTRHHTTAPFALCFGELASCGQVGAPKRSRASTTFYVTGGQRSFDCLAATVSPARACVCARHPRVPAGRLRPGLNGGAQITTREAALVLRCGATAAASTPQFVCAPLQAASLPTSHASNK